ncbi:MAG: hypothetical protein JSU65_09780 [Candidatus Zixiibacteriota bacterium]|nr:MAG: hypothetical protein JSU65_09780 [candidate division Zixibacteria bacterium]
MSEGVSVANYQRPVNLLEIAERGRLPRTANESDGKSFREMFSRELAADRSVSFSKHASRRLFSRKIELTDDQLGRIAGAIDKASGKGSRETLVLLDDTALVVSVKNRTVVTVFDRENLRDGVVTSIDSAVIL